MHFFQGIHLVMEETEGRAAGFPIWPVEHPLGDRGPDCQARRAERMSLPLLKLPFPGFHLRSELCGQAALRIQKPCAGAPSFHLPNAAVVGNHDLTYFLHLLREILNLLLQGLVASVTPIRASAL